MKATTHLPSHYVCSRSIDLSKSIKLLLLLNLAGVGLFLLFGGIFSYLIAALRKSFPMVKMAIGDPASTLEIIGWILVGFVLVLILHEGVHGVFFWIITRDRPIFGFRGAFAYTAAPNWYIPRNPYLIVGLSPLVLISLVGTLASLLIPTEGLFPLIFALTINASGAVGDLYIVGWLLTQPADTLVNDGGDAITIYYPGETG